MYIRKKLIGPKGKLAYLHEGTRLGSNVIDGVDGYPHHGSEAHAHAHPLRPFGILIVCSISHWFVRNNVEDENGDHHCRCKVFPAQEPKDSWFMSSHLFDAVAKAVGTKEPTNGDGLEENHPK